LEFIDKLIPYPHSVYFLRNRQVTIDKYGLIRGKRGRVKNEYMQIVNKNPLFY